MSSAICLNLQSKILSSGNGLTSQHFEGCQNKRFVLQNINPLPSDKILDWSIRLLKICRRHIDSCSNEEICL